MTNNLRPPEPPDSEWYSICSAHAKYNADCSCCNVGQWKSRQEIKESHALWDFSHWLWRKWANRQPNEFLEQAFPKLKGTHHTVSVSKELEQLVEEVIKSEPKHWWRLRLKMLKLRMTGRV